MDRQAEKQLAEIRCTEEAEISGMTDEREINISRGVAGSEFGELQFTNR